MLAVHYLQPLDMTQADFAKRIGISRVRLNELIRGKRGVTADTAIRLSKALGTTAEMWMNAQATYDLAVAPKVSGVSRIRRKALKPSEDTAVTV
ncbi:MAG: HigA family addiction module antidote protein [Kofleriaceae bacterium]|nr:HigA family addiction module antidote protein [Kofleriaceae bacterium]